MAVYVSRAVAFHPDVLTLDEERYLDCARRICAGYLVTDDNPDFVNGPGYPAVLAPFVKLGLPLYWARVMNGLWLGFGCVFLFLTVRQYANTAWAVVAAFWTMLQPSMLRLGPFLMSEAFMMFCVGAFVWSFCRAQRAQSRIFLHCFVAATALLAMVMTRVMFGHVTTVMLMLSLLGLPFLKRLRQPLGRTALIMGLGLAMCLPYLAYTKAKTGKNWCWSTNSGELLYWVTSANPGENGFWYCVEDALNLPELAPNHREFFLKVTQLPVLEREAAFTAKALDNLRTVPPERLAYNWLCNVCRMCFGFPRAFMQEELSRGVMVAFNAPLLLLLLGASAVWLLRPNSVPPEVSLLGLAALVYLAGSTLPPALIRYAMVVTPLLWIVVSAVLCENVEVRLSQKDRVKATV
ncbi:MAG TPA: hypothetical protein VK956_17915 [Verrucomicrobium sp.]|nr:hypothetical protein [Verrucomicrobium sp.]